MWQRLAVGARSQTVLSPGRVPSGFPTRRVTHRRTRSLAQRRRTQDFPLPRAQGAQFPSALPSTSEGRSYFALPIHSVWAAPSSLLAWLTQRGEGNRVWGQALSLAPNVGLQVALDVPASSSHVSPGLYPLWALAPRAEKQCHCLPTAPRLCRWLQSRSGAELWVMVYPSPPAPRKGSCSTFVLWQCVHRRVPWGALGTSISCPHWVPGESPSITPMGCLGTALLMAPVLWGTSFNGLQNE